MHTAIRYTPLSNLAPTTNSNTHLNKSFGSRLLSYCPRLISPISWWHCFTLLYGLSTRKERSFKYALLHLFLLILVGVWCFLYWMITDDAGRYLTLLTSVSGNKTDIIHGRHQFDQIFWRTAVKTIWISITFGLINACGVSLAAVWRRRLCKEFYNIIFRSPNGCILYETSQQAAYDLPTQLTNDIRQFTSHLSITFFGSLFFSGFLAVSTAVIVFSVYIVKKTNGDKNGIAICFGSFIFSVILLILVSYRFNRTAVEQLKSKGKVRSFLQRLQTNAECIAFFASSRFCELVSYLKLNDLVHKWNVQAALWYAAVNIPLILMDSLGGFITYILPAILFFFLRNAQQQTPEDATKYLSIIAFYGYVFWLLSSLMWISESCLIAITLGDRLWHLKQRLLRLQTFHLERIEQDQTNQITFESTDLIEVRKLTIVAPDEHEQRILQSNINLYARRGECVLVNGPTGCGKTSLFRICAGLWPIDAEIIRLPARQQTIYIPQRPYLPVGSLRFQALFLLDIRSKKNESVNIDHEQIRNLFQLVNMDYILDRYDFDAIVDWSTHLSIGEQQRLAFIRLFALFKYRPEETSHTLVMFDESTSALDTKTEAVIYQILQDLRVWFVTISHRPSLIKYHHKELTLQLPSGNQDENFFSLNIGPEELIDRANNQSVVLENLNETVVPETQLFNVMRSNSSPGYTALKKSNNFVKDIRDIWKVIHVSFGEDGKLLRIQTYTAWCICLAVIGCYTYISYRLTVQTGAIFRVLPDYAASKIDIQEGRSRIARLVWQLLLHIFGLSALYSIQLCIGQYLAALYTRRQSRYIARLLLDDDENHSTLYHTSTLKSLPNIISHELADLNVQLFFLLVGSMYYNGLIGVLVKCIPYTLLLVQQSSSTKGVLIVYCYQIFISLLIMVAVQPYFRANVLFENSFALFTNAQKRIDLQAEQIALSDRGVMDIEHKQLRSKLNESIRAQQRSGFFYGLLVACSVLGNWSNTIINYGIPSMIYFHWSPNATTAEAASIIALTVYTGYLQGNLAVFNSHGQPFSQVLAAGRRIAQNLEQMVRLRESHYQARLSEMLCNRRIEIKSNNTNQQALLSLNNVNVCLPTDPLSILIRGLSFALNSSSSLVITGPSGCGKSSLLRLLAGLQYNITDNSSIYIPSHSAIIFIPQQIHLIEGTLREQLNYFRQAKNMSTYTNDYQLKELLTRFNLIHLVDRYSLDLSTQLWSRTLSLGEQQRLIIVVALVALLKSNDGTYVNESSIKYFILDETTAGCDETTEKVIYEHLQTNHIRYISISHRHQLLKYHTHQLIIDPKNQSYQFLEMS
ncbi:unnamed protein product [Adineta ricciae]|uniref:ABC transporter domain-containing protein n=1 Tax=Adineta ricciae TaxID=249248 RepID=A0A815DR50_ADIRI|nr:unnamed protein product [Adineta ricciae]